MFLYQILKTYDTKYTKILSTTLWVILYFYSPYTIQQNRPVWYPVQEFERIPFIICLPDLQRYVKILVTELLLFDVIIYE